MTQPPQKGLVREIGRWGLTALTLNITIGAGVFGLPSKIYGLTGTWSLLAYIVCAALIALIVLCFAEVGSRFTETGGPYLYAREAFGEVIGFEVGWLLWAAREVAFAALFNLLIGYLSYFWPAVGAGWPRALATTVLAVAMTTINVIGVREAAFVSTMFTVAKLAPLLLFVFTGIFFINPQQFTPPAEIQFGEFSRAVLLLIFAFSGFEMAAVPAGETRDPKRHLSFALLTAMSVTGLLYLLIQVVCIGTLPGLAQSERPLVDASSRFLGAAGASLISVGALISITGTLSSTLLTGPRILFAMAEQGQLPRALAATHRRFHTPHIAILISAVVMLVISLQSSFMSALTISTVIRLLTYISTCIALPTLRCRKDAPPARFRAPAGVFIAVAATALSLWVLFNCPPRDAALAFLAAVLGLPVYFAYRSSRKS
jgi:APA family basic amino acid/polyamine antiporter